MSLNELRDLLLQFSVETNLVAALALRKLHAYRFLKHLVVPLTGGIIIARAIHSKTSGKNLLSILLEKYDFSSNSSSINFFIGDIIGLLIVVSALDSAEFFFGLTKKGVIDYFFGFARKIPFVRDHLAKEVLKHKGEFEKSLNGPARDIEASLTQLPAEGRSKEEILALMGALTVKENEKWQSGRVSGESFLQLLILMPFFILTISFTLSQARCTRPT